MKRLIFVCLMMLACGQVQADLMLYTVTGDVAVNSGTDPLGMGGSTLTVWFEYDDTAIRTGRSGGDTDMFTPTSSIFSTFTGTAGGLNDGTFENSAVSNDLSEKDITTLVIRFSLPDGVVNQLDLDNTITDGTSSLTNVLDPIDGLSGVFQSSAFLSFDFTTSYDYTFSTSVTPVVVPEPSTYMMLALAAIAGLIYYRRKGYQECF